MCTDIWVGTSEARGIQWLIPVLHFFQIFPLDWFNWNSQHSVSFINVTRRLNKCTPLLYTVTTEWQRDSILSPCPPHAPDFPQTVPMLLLPDPPHLRSIWTIPSQSLLITSHCSQSRPIQSCTKTLLAIHYKVFASNFLHLTVKCSYHCLQLHSMNQKNVNSISTQNNSAYTASLINLLPLPQYDCSQCPYSHGITVG